jgi:2-methylcitrate dehydratase PrpD
MLPEGPHANNEAQPVIPEYLIGLSRFLCGTQLSDIPHAVRERCQRVIADCVAVIGAGMQTPEMRALRESYLAGKPAGTSWVIGGGVRASPEDAALLNGTAGTFHDFDEGNTAAHGHPGMQAIPAAVAYAQHIGASGGDLLRAAALGYEVGARVGAATKMRVAVHPHGTYGVIGAAVAVASLRRFDAAQMRTTINIAATMAMATNRQAMLDEATVRNIYTGHSGLAGHLATQLTAAGFRGQRDGIGFTFGNVIADGFDPARAVAGLGRDWLLADGYFKLHPAGRYAHAALDALDDALQKVAARLALDAIERIDVSAFRLAALLSGRRIATSFGAKFSIPFALATVLYHGRSGVDCFDEAAVANPAIQALASRVEVVENAGYTAHYPARHLCDLTIRLRDGRTLGGRCEIMKGDPANPHRAEDVERKYFTLAEPIWGTARARWLYDTCLNLERVPDMRTLAMQFAL